MMVTMESMESGTPQIEKTPKLKDGGRLQHPEQPSSLSCNRAVAWMCVSAVLAVALVLSLSNQNHVLTQAARNPSRPLPEVPISPDCLLPLGGGAAQRGGSFPHFIYQSCQLDLDVYLQQYGLYYAQVSHVAQAAIGYISDIQQARPGTRDQVFVFDIDETVLSNADEWSHPAPLDAPHTQRCWLHTLLHKAGLDGVLPRRSPQTMQQQAAQSEPHRHSVHSVTSPRYPAALKGVYEGDKPPLVAVRELYYFLIAHNYSVAFITGRKEAARAFTAHNLASAGYGEQCGPGVVPSLTRPCYVALHLRDNSDDRPASVYKPERRQALQAAGFTVVGNIGDQFSDLDGLHVAESNWKLPNSMYYIL